jgi:hypothetical protein
MDKLRNLWRKIFAPYYQWKERKRMAARIASLTEQDPYIYK